MSSRHLYGRAFVDGMIKENVLVTVRGETLADVAQTNDVPAGAERTNGVIVPGFVDIHIHGGNGADFMDASASGNENVLAFHATQGTTALAATTLSGSVADIRNAVEAIGRTAANRPAGAEICGIHLEGPFINQRHAGAQDQASIRPADIQELDHLLSLSRFKYIVTIAPELPAARALIEHFRNRVVFSIGHTAADYSEAVTALEWGASHFTHLFNAMTGMHHREPGVVGAAFESGHATAELIADGIHVHPAVLRIAAQALPNRAALITDAIRACGMPDGAYKLYGYDVIVDEGSARLANGTLAGSVLTMSRAVQNMVELAGIPLERVIPMATEVPARILGVSDRKGKLDIGYDADVVLVSERLEVERVFTRGEEVSK